MTFKLMILGTASSMPMKNRNLSSAALRYHGEIALLDCAEGTQQQLMRSKFSLMRVNNILITHWHLDHFMGIYGLLATMVMQNRSVPLTIYGPKATEPGPKKFIDIIKKTKTNFPLQFKEITKQGKLYKFKDITVEAVKLKHSVPSFGYVFTQIKPPKFNRNKAVKLGVPEGPMFAKLQAGRSVKLKSGKTVKPSQVLIGGEQKKQVAYYVDSIPFSVKLA